MLWHANHLKHSCLAHRHGDRKHWCACCRALRCWSQILCPCCWCCKHKDIFYTHQKLVSCSGKQWVLWGQSCRICVSVNTAAPGWHSQRSISQVKMQCDRKRPPSRTSQAGTLQQREQQISLTPAALPPSSVGSAKGFVLFSTLSFKPKERGF